MCAIVGYTGSIIDGVIEKMATRMHHRGPDGSGVYHDNNIHLAHQRLSIIDLAQGAQPMQAEDGNLCVVFNGEIYNNKTLRNQLEQRGHTFTTDHSDTEVLLHGWSEWGEALPDKLNGMWAFAIYDKTRQSLFLSRDRYGQKPLFYAQTKERLVFASELSALREHPELTFDQDEMSLRKYFAYAFIPAPRTIYKNIFKLPAAHNMLYNLSSGEARIWRYWEYVIEPFESIPDNPEEAWGEQLLELLSESVKLRMMSDVPLGVLLSGGIDSSCIAALASRHCNDLQTFSIGFNEDSYDESPYALAVSKHIGSTHHASYLSRDEARELAPHILSRIDEPFADDSLIPTWMVCREARKRVTVALGGDGGDELFCGYLPFKVWKWARRYNIYLPRALHWTVEKLIGGLHESDKYMSLPMKLKRFFRASGQGMKVWVPAIMAPLGIDDLCELFADKNLGTEELYSEAIEAWNECASHNIADRMTMYYIQLYLQNEILVKGDRASMLNSLELRCPFLDVNVADFARRIPAGYRYRNGQTKYILKKSLEKILPKDILYRGKQGFSPPTANWFRSGQLAIDKAAQYPGRNFTATALKQHIDCRQDYTRFLWAQYSLDHFA